MSFRERRAGFALVITVVLLALLVLLLVGLASLTRIETAIAGNSQRQIQARQNALLALDVALGQLQLQAGPDQRVSATAAHFDGRAGTRHWTGIWDAADSSAGTPRAWLVSGSESGTPTPGSPPATDVRVSLVGAKSSGVADDIVAPLQEIRARAVAGLSGDAVIGRYAWWVGDQGVRAPVAVPEAVDAIRYEPYDSADWRRRVRQQLALGAGPQEFEPRDEVNRAISEQMTAFNQLAFFRPIGGGDPIGLTLLQHNFHRWAPNNFAVLANTNLGGLRRDLSLKPDLLGDAFAAWADYPAYMENPRMPEAPAPLPAYGLDPLRRRHRLAPVRETGGAIHSVAPVLTYFLLTFNVRTEGGSAAVRPVQARARWMISLWNPYTSALVPEDLRLEVSGLPASLQVVNATRGTTPISFSLQEVVGSPLQIRLPWNHETELAPDRQSWLPGRVYTWISEESLTGAIPPEGYASRFYPRARNLDQNAGQGVQRRVSDIAIDGNDQCYLQVGNTSVITARLFAVGSDGDVPLATFTSPVFQAFSTTPQELRRASYQFSYLFRLAESFDTPAMPEMWLTSPARDPHRGVLAADSFVVGPNGNRPELYQDYDVISAPDRLLDRAHDNASYNEDVPLFELPRGPLLSLGVLQHVAVAGQRPFAVGNSWGATASFNGLPANSLFDRFYFSGLVETARTTALTVLPNALLRTVRRSDGEAAGLDDVSGTVRRNDGFSSKHLLSGGAFNLNSAEVGAWTAVLRGVRFPSSEGFLWLDSDATSGTASDTATRSITSSDAQFFRFSQSAQETLKADVPLGVGGSTYAASATVPPQAPDTTSQAQTHLFRRGMRSLASEQVTALAHAIVERLQRKHAASGPFRAVEEFLNPSTLFGGASLLEEAIASAGINASVAEFSSQWLTQGDVMTALAPVLFARSDTFVIRVYGEAVNPVTASIEGRAWAEATVQRYPEYFDPAQPEETPLAELNSVNARFGRRFKITSFRWLTTADI